MERVEQEKEQGREVKLEGVEVGGREVVKDVSGEVKGPESNVMERGRDGRGRAGEGTGQSGNSGRG